MKTTYDSPITITHVLTLVRALRYGLAMKQKPWELCDTVIGEIRNMLEADQPAPTETGPVCDDPYDQCLVAGCIYIRDHKGKCFQPGDVVPAKAETAPQGAPRPGATTIMFDGSEVMGTPVRAPQGAPRRILGGKGGQTVGLEPHWRGCPCSECDETRFGSEDKNPGQPSKGSPDAR